MKTYEEYKDESAKRTKSIMAKYGAPKGARPPHERNFLPASSDRDYRRYAFIKKRTLEGWPKSERKYP